MVFYPTDNEFSTKKWGEQAAYETTHGWYVLYGISDGQGESFYGFLLYAIFLCNVKSSLVWKVLIHSN